MIRAVSWESGFISKDGVNTAGYHIMFIFNSEISENRGGVTMQKQKSAIPQPVVRQQRHDFLRQFELVVIVELCIVFLLFTEADLTGLSFSGFIKVFSRNTICILKALNAFLISSSDSSPLSSCEHSSSLQQTHPTIMSADYEPVSSEERNLDVDFVTRAKNDESIVGICYKGFHRSHKYIETV